MKKKRLDVVLVERGIISSRHKAQEQIKRGLVLLNGEKTAKPSLLVSPGDQLEVLCGEKYVSRGGEKLEAALERFKIDVEGQTALDIGASTGGFTDCLLQHGAVRVVAVDVGHGQLAEKLKKDPRACCFEKMNARNLKSSDFGGKKFGLIVVDVSFISILKIFPAVVDLAAVGGTLVALVKPQFEAGQGKLGSGGVVRDEVSRREAVEKVERFFKQKEDWKLVGTMPSPLTGGDGNEEYLLCAQKFAKSSSS